MRDLGIPAAPSRRIRGSRAHKAGAYWVVSEKALAEFMSLERPRGVGSRASEPQVRGEAG